MVVQSRGFHQTSYSSVQLRKYSRFIFIILLLACPELSCEGNFRPSHVLEHLSNKIQRRKCENVLSSNNQFITIDVLLPFN